MQRQRKQLKSQIRGNGLFAVMVLFLTLTHSGCSDSPKTPSTQPSAAAPVQKQALSSLPTPTSAPQVAQRTAEVYAYTPGGRRDPFSPIMERETKKAKSGQRPPLEKYNIGEFKLSGIVWGGFGYSAMLEGPDGKGYFVRAGSIMGPNGGVVKKITQNTMIIEEKYKTYSGETERKEIILEFRKKQEETP